jgi:hypothetical protein
MWKALRIASWNNQFTKSGGEPEFNDEAKRRKSTENLGKYRLVIRVS